MHTGDSFLGVKRPGCEADLSPPYIVLSLRMKGAMSPFPLHVFMVCVGETLPIHHGDKK